MHFVFRVFDAVRVVYIVCQAIHLTPTDDVLWYDLALAEEDFAVNTFQLPATQRCAFSAV
jgi:hypothetical protein